MRAGILALAVLCGLAACSGGSESAPVASTAPAGSTSTAADCEPTAGGSIQGSPSPGAATSSVKLGPSADITEEEAAKEAPAREGKPLILTGTVYADCTTPAAGAVINVWQTDARGVYGPGQSSDNLRCCYLQGSVETDAEGRYTIETIEPGHYRGEEPPPPAHIHMEVHHDGGGVLTEVFFAGDPYLEGGEPEGEVIELREESGTLTGQFDIFLSES